MTRVPSNRRDRSADALRDRERYGPREPLPRPMTISEAEEHLTGRAV